MKTFLLFFPILIFAAGCSDSSSPSRCGSNNCIDISENQMVETEISGIFVGMTRAQVISVLGGEFISHSGIGRPPVVDSFPYTENGVVKYIYVIYQDGIVREASDGFDWPFRVN